MIKSIFLNLLLISLSFQAFSQCHPDDFAALKAIYDATNGATTWSNTMGWDIVANNATPPLGCDLSTLHGIDLANGRVSIIDLESNGLTGTLPTTELSNLVALREFNVATSGNPLIPNPNNISSSIPTELGNLTTLTTINLSRNDFSGSIPTSLTNLTNLEALLLNNNNLTGSIPASIGNLTQLENLQLSYNNLTGTIPSSIGSCTFLKQFFVEFNNLSGNIPTQLGDCSDLINIAIRGNMLTGTLSSNFSTLSNLVTFYANSNMLSGTLPDFNGAPNLELIEFSNNDFTGTLPSTWGNLTNLLSLSINKNNLTGSVPSTYSNLVNVHTFTVSENNLSGSIPSSFGNLPDMSNFNVSLNPNLGGAFPIDLGNWSNLVLFRAEDCGFTGSIPTTFANWSNCTEFRVGGNQLTGLIPDIFSSMSHLDHASFNDNFFSGGIPVSLSEPDSLHIFYIQNNQLTGCHQSDLTYLCSTLEMYNIDTGNTFDAPWIDFCANNEGVCTTGSSTYCTFNNGLPTQLEVEGNACINGVINASQAIQLTPQVNTPTNPAIGMMYFDANSNKLRVWDGAFWQSCW